MYIQGFAYFQHTLPYPFCIVATIKIANHFFYFILPIRVPYFLMYAFISKNGQLAVFDRHIYQNCIALLGFLHFQSEENFGRLVYGIYVFATAFYKYADLSACPLFSLLHCFHDAVLFFGRKKFLFSCKQRHGSVFKIYLNCFIVTALCCKPFFLFKTR